MTQGIAIIGAGMAGLSCATRLTAAGRDVCLYDKGRRPSGRMASRPVEVDGYRFAFDYGAQYMTVRDPGFAEAVQAWTRGGIVAPWPAAGDDAWVGTPGMDAPLATMAGALDVRWSCHVRGIRRDTDGWHVAHDAGEDGPFAEIVVALPAEQVGPLVAGIDDSLATLADTHRSAPCWTVMLGFDRPLALPPLIERDGIIDSAACNAAKPGRSPGEAWTIHATLEWSAAHLEAERDTVIDLLRDALAQRVDLPRPVHAAAHRWRYARSVPAGIGSYRLPALALSACGDWLIAPRVESAWLSGQHAATAILGDSG
ncbi:deoxyribodipyrimidine photolyase [Sphingomonas sp. Leaf407]|uniref:NAD(P)/FAD-dependent oxidoreductase n=1 Tax=unclassified Sphingomonas TaxID=196159 RepID=UPI0006F22B3D|nr:MULTISPECIES: FAD-dependent oxidoreductase [unclassified Sphingomonas]KQN39650.1 deoxyribodipyrimidine photolyase [Sphingomonas sp. Leaf42]KQT28925.1 deoxyribodipyrimidine photolyase [Sphingomonas sp. Leaf407]